MTSSDNSALHMALIIGLIEKLNLNKGCFYEIYNLLNTP